MQWSAYSVGHGKLYKQRYQHEYLAKLQGTLINWMKWLIIFNNCGNKWEMLSRGNVCTVAKTIAASVQSPWRV